MDKLMKYMKNKKVGSTPIVKYNNIYYKLEIFNPSGSIKDRAAYHILENYYKKGLIKKGSTIVIPTSGNMGISLAYFASKFQIKVVVVMPENVSVERYQILKRYGAVVVLTNGMGGMELAIKKAIDLSKQLGYVFIDQFNSVYNKEAHYKTAQEIITAMPDIDYIVSGIGTAGTISGIGEYLKGSKIKIIGVEPYESPAITLGKKGKHLIEGLGAGFIPPLINLEDIHKVVRIKSSEVIDKFKNDNPLLLGKSGIACDIAARKILEKDQNVKILVIVPDGIDRYESMIE